MIFQFARCTSCYRWGTLLVITKVFKNTKVKVAYSIWIKSSQYPPQKKYKYEKAGIYQIKIKDHCILLQQNNIRVADILDRTVLGVVILISLRQILI